MFCRKCKRWSHEYTRSLEQKLSETDAEAEEKRVGQERGGMHAWRCTGHAVWTRFCLFIVLVMSCWVLYQFWSAGVSTGLQIDESSKLIGFIIGKKIYYVQVRGKKRLIYSVFNWVVELCESLGLLIQNSDHVELVSSNLCEHKSDFLSFDNHGAFSVI